MPTISIHIININSHVNSQGTDMLINLFCNFLAIQSHRNAYSHLNRSFPFLWIKHLKEQSYAYFLNVFQLSDLNQSQISNLYSTL